MRKIHTQILSTLACAAFLAGCQAYPSSLPAPTRPAQALDGRVEALLAERTTNNLILEGRIVVPAGRRLLATSDDLKQAATVVLSDQDGVARAAGLTVTDDTTGKFRLYQSTTTFQPEPGHFYTLEVMKRSTESEQTLVSLKTLLYYTGKGKGWSSIAGSSSIDVSLATTTVASFVADGTLTWDEALGVTTVEEATTAMGSLDAEGGFVAFDRLDTPNWLDLMALEKRAAQLESRLWTNSDPNAAREADTTVIKVFTVRSQEDLESLRHAAVVVGNVTIDVPRGTPFKLNLSRLTQVQGKLTINSLGGELDVDAPTSLLGLGSLEEVSGDLTINDAHLTSLAGLEALRRVGGALTIARETAPLPAYKLLDGHEEEDMEEEVEPILPTNLDLNALRHLEEVGGTLSLRHDGVTTLPSFSLLASLGGLVLDLPRFEGTTLEAFSAAAVTRTFALHRLSALTTLAGGPQIQDGETKLQNFTIEDCDALTSLSELAGLGQITAIVPWSITSRTGTLRIVSNDNLVDLGAPAVAPIPAFEDEPEVEGQPASGLYGVTKVGLQATRFLNYSTELTISDNALLDCGGAATAWRAVDRELLSVTETVENNATACPLAE